MPSALVSNNTVVDFYPYDVPNKITLPDGTDIHCANIGWSGDGYSILPATYADSPPDPTSYPTGNNYSIANGAVSVTRTWITPTPQVVVPKSVTNAQARYVLMQNPSPVNQGKTLFDDIDAAVTAGGGVDQMAWEYSNNINRNSSLVTSMASALNLTSDQIDQLFIAAAAVTF